MAFRPVVYPDQYGPPRGVTSGLFWNQHSEGDAPQAAPETEVNSHHVGRYHPARHFLARHLLFSADIATHVEVAAEPETNPHHIGRYQAARHLVAQHLLYVPNTSASAPVADTATDFDIRVIPYADQAVRVAHRMSYYRSDNADITVPVEAEQNLNPWRARRLKNEWCTPSYWLISGQAVAGTPEETQQPDFNYTRKYTPGKHNVLPLYRFQQDLSGETTSSNDEIMQPWTARFLQNQWNTPLYGLSNSKEPEQFDTQPETPQPWVARFLQNQWGTPLYGLLASQEHEEPEFTPGEPETNPHHVGRYRSGHHRVAKHLFFYEDTSESGPVTEHEHTLPQWRPQQIPVRWCAKQAAQYLYQSVDTSESGPIEVFESTLPQWKAQLLRTDWKALQSACFLYRSAVDTSESGPVTVTPTPTPSQPGQAKGNDGWIYLAHRRRLRSNRWVR